MNIFKLDVSDDAEVYSITTNTFVSVTKKELPFFNETSNARKYHAICPECNNPISIVGLFTDKKKPGAKTHGKHVRRDVVGLPEFSQERFSCCSLENPVAFDCMDKHKSESRATQIVDLVKDYPEIVFDNVRNIMGINFHEDVFFEMMSMFIKNNGPNYKYVTMWNLPYSFINVQNQVSIFSRRIFKNKFGREIETSINANSKYFKVDKGFIKKKKDGYSNIYMYFNNHVLPSGSESETIDLIIEEEHKGELNKVLTHKLNLNEKSFMNAVNKVKRMRNFGKTL